MRAGITETIRRATGASVVQTDPLGGGCVGDVYKLTLSDGRVVVAKTGDPGGGLDIEGYMLDYLAAHSRLPVPGVLIAEDDLLLMEYIPADGALDARAQIHAADLLADLHGVRGHAFGLERDTLIGGLHQPNPQTPSWIDFFRDQRILFMARCAMEAGRLPGRVMARIDALAGWLDRWIEEPEYPSLIHGDMWGGNVLCGKGRIAGFVDPAIYYADPEIELAFSTLFGTFGDAFFERYGELRPLRPGFFEERVALYNLYPLLVHVRLFGGSYVGSVERTLTRFGA
ncbi:MAG: fructosamine kinase family protein [Rhodospirillales bacterium]|nr:fructosamine kinase family protein [Rhodospirillales bacterium]